VTQPAATRMRVGLVVLGGLAVLAVAALLWTQVIEPRLNRSIADTLGEGDYRLSATDGTEFTEASLRGAPSAVFFGFTHCPEVCPTTLGEIAGWQEELAADGKQLRVFFVTVDPERDTTEMLRDYVSWVPGVVGVSGSPDEIAKAIKAFRIFASKVPLDDGGYTMDHSASLLLFDAKGRFVEPIGYGEDPTRAMDKLARLVSA
jgi:protein SCO1/2